MKNPKFNEENPYSIFLFDTMSYFLTQVNTQIPFHTRLSSVYPKEFIHKRSRFSDKKYKRLYILRSKIRRLLVLQKPSKTRKKKKIPTSLRRFLPFADQKVIAKWRYLFLYPFRLQKFFSNSFSFSLRSAHLRKKLKKHYFQFFHHPSFLNFKNQSLETEHSFLRSRFLLLSNRKFLWNRFFQKRIRSSFKKNNPFFSSSTSSSEKPNLTSKKVTPKMTSVSSSTSSLTSKTFFQNYMKLCSQKAILSSPFSSSLSSKKASSKAIPRTSSSRKSFPHPSSLTKGSKKVSR